MTVAEAAKLMEISPDLVYRLCRAGKLGHSRIGLRRGVIRIDRADVEAFLISRKVEACDDADEPTPRAVRTYRTTLRVPDMFDRKMAEKKARVAARAARKSS